MSHPPPHPPRPPRRRPRLFFGRTSETPAACLLHSFPLHPGKPPRSQPDDDEEKEEEEEEEDLDMGPGFLSRNTGMKTKMAKTRQFEQKATTPPVRDMMVLTPQITEKVVSLISASLEEDFGIANAIEPRESCKKTHV